MPDYHVREENGLIQGQVQSNSASEAAWHMAEQLVITHDVPQNQEWLVFEVTHADLTTRVSVQFAITDETLHFSDQTLEPLETPLALTLNKRTSNGRPPKTSRAV